MGGKKTENLGEKKDEERQDLALEVGKGLEAKKGTKRQLDRLALATEVSGKKNEKTKKIKEKIDNGELNIADFQSLSKKLQKRFSLIKDKLSKKESLAKEFVLENKKDIITLKYLLDYLTKTNVLEINDKEEFVLRIGDVEINMNENLEFIDELENALKSDKQENEVSYYEKMEYNLRTIKPSEFLRQDSKLKLDLISNIKSLEDLKSGMLVVFNFGGNKRLEKQIGLGDVMPSSIRKLALDGEVYSRRGNQGFYSQNGAYLPIFDGSRIKVIENKDGYNPQAEYENTFGKSTNKEESAEGNNEEGKSEGTDKDRDLNDKKEIKKLDTNEIKFKDIKEVAESFLVDALLLKTIVYTLKEQEDMNGFELLHMAGRYIQNAQAKFENNHKDLKAIEQKAYTPKFIVFALDRFNLFNNYSKLDINVIGFIKDYYKAKGLKLNLKEEEEIREYRTKSKPEVIADYSQPREGEGLDIVEDNEKLKEWKEKLYTATYNQLLSEGMDHLEAEKVAKMQVFYNKQILINSHNHLGTYYQGRVTINSYNGHQWTIKNSCVGGAMKTLENLPLRVMNGQQKDQKYASNYYWGGKDKMRIGGRMKSLKWIDTLVENHQENVEKIRVSPSNCDALIGAKLLPGEVAIAGLWNHAILVYKNLDGRIMMIHSGADVRPWRNNSRSKMNEVPLSLYLAKKQKDYAYPTSRSEIRFVPMNRIVKSNLNHRDSDDFIDYYRKGQNESEDLA